MNGHDVPVCFRGRWAGARGGTRTRTPLLASGPKPGASTNFATRAAAPTRASPGRRFAEPGILAGAHRQTTRQPRHSPEHLCGGAPKARVSSSDPARKRRGRRVHAGRVSSVDNRAPCLSITTRTSRLPRWLCPRRLRPAVAAIYRFARTADDIADEGDARRRHAWPISRRYGADLVAVASARAPSARWPIGLLAAEHGDRVPTPCPCRCSRSFSTPSSRTCVKHDYADRAELLDYCRRSANPVGRLLLHLYGMRRAQALQQSDAICTALQLVNFWQDLGVDVGKGAALRPAQRMRAARRRSGAAAGPARQRADADADRLDGCLDARHDAARRAAGARGSGQCRLGAASRGPGRAAHPREDRARGGFDVLEHRPTLRWYDAPAAGLARPAGCRPRVATGRRKIA